LDLNLKGKTALITGASKGIGAAVARELAGEGCHLHLAARSSDQLAALARELESRHGVKVTTSAKDLSKHEDVLALAAECPAPDILVNNAGAIPAGNLQEVTHERWKAAWDLKVFGYVGLTRAILPKMYERRSGVVVCVIGAAAFGPNPNYIAGCMANVALNMMVSCLGADAMDHGVRVVAVNPGATASERQTYLAKEAARRKLGDPERYLELMTQYPGGRTATCEEIAHTVAFLASDKSSYTSASQIVIDAGHGFRR
jgi:NAD(P)-dependent dehydrogenase (short-subunit alcohol dehydrogenase family)